MSHQATIKAINLVEQGLDSGLALYMPLSAFRQYCAEKAILGHQLPQPYIKFLNDINKMEKPYSRDGEEVKLLGNKVEFSGRPYRWDDLDFKGPRE